jgi:hypothetical protein
MLKNFLTDQLTLAVAIGCKPNSFGSAQRLANGLELSGLVAALCRARSVKTFRNFIERGPAKLYVVTGLRTVEEILLLIERFPQANVVLVDIRPCHKSSAAPAAPSTTAATMRVPATARRPDRHGGRGTKATPRQKRRAWSVLGQQHRTALEQVNLRNEAGLLISIWLYIDDIDVLFAGGVAIFLRNPSRTDRPAPEFAPSLHYLVQVLSAVKAVSADACVG